MRRIATLLCLMLLIGGCGDKTQQRTGEAPSESTTQTPGNAQDSDIDSATPTLDIEETRAPVTTSFIVSRSDQFGTVSPRVHWTYTEPEEAELLAEAFESAEKIDGILDLDFPEYDVVYDSGDSRTSYHLWLGQEEDQRGLYTTTEDTGQGYRLTLEATQKLRSLIFYMHKYTKDIAEENGYVVYMYDQIFNAELLEQFADHVQQGVADDVHIAHYTDEGDPIFYDIYFDGTTFRYLFDRRMDRYANPFRQAFTCENWSAKDGIYTLTGCNEEHWWFELRMPGVPVEY